MATSSTDQVNAIAASERPLQALGPIANAAFADYLSRKATNTIRAQRFDLALFADHLAAGVTDGAVFGLHHQASLCYDGGYNPLSVCGFAASGEHRRWVVFFYRVLCCHSSPNHPNSISNQKLFNVVSRCLQGSVGGDEHVSKLCYNDAKNKERELLALSLFYACVKTSVLGVKYTWT